MIYIIYVFLVMLEKTMKPTKVNSTFVLFLLNSFLHLIFAGEANENVLHAKSKTDSGQDTNKTLEILKDVNTKLYIGTEVNMYQSKSLSL